MDIYNISEDDAKFYLQEEGASEALQKGEQS